VAPNYVIRTVVTPAAERPARDPDWESLYAHDSDPGPRKTIDQEAKMPRKKPGKKKVALPILNLDAAGSGCLPSTSLTITRTAHIWDWAREGRGAELAA